MEDIEGMSQITPNGLPDDGCLSFLFGHLHVIGRPVFSRPRFKGPSEKFDEPKNPSDAPLAPSAKCPPPGSADPLSYPGSPNDCFSTRSGKNQPKEAKSFRFSKEEYQLSISTYSG
jgi:hypothetical protein